MENARVLAIWIVSILVAGGIVYLAYKKGYLLPLIKKVWVFVVLAGLVASVVYLVRTNYVWVGFQAKDKYASIEHCQANLGPLEYELEAMREARNTAFELQNEYFSE